MEWGQPLNVLDVVGVHRELLPKRLPHPTRELTARIDTPTPETQRPLSTVWSASSLEWPLAPTQVQVLSTFANPFRVDSNASPRTRLVDLGENLHGGDGGWSVNQGKWAKVHLEHLRHPISSELTANDSKRPYDVRLATPALDGVGWKRI